MSKTLRSLLANVVQALKIRQPRYLRSIVGDPSSWSVRTCPPTELQISADPLKALHELVQILVPGLPVRPEALDDVPGADLLLRRSRNFYYPPNELPDTSVDRTELMFVNGIATDENVAMINAACIHQYFGLPLTVLYNATCGVVPDLAECAFGKGWGTVTEAAASAFPALYEALRNPEVERVILFGHSQGTIISAVLLEVLRELLDPAQRELFQPDSVGGEAKAAQSLLREPGGPAAMVSAQHDVESDDDEVVKLFDWRRGGLLRLRKITPVHLQKLEIYAFANCASRMQPLLAAGGRYPAAPFIESFGNENDIVAKLGVLAPQSGRGSASIGGARYRRAGGWGHLLNAHYFWPMQQQLAGEDAGFQAMKGTDVASPRLYQMLIPVRS